MTQFEYLSTFISILYAIMVGRAIATLSGLSLETIYWRHVAWVAILLLNILQTWWKRWSGHDDLYHYGWFLLAVAHTIPLMFAMATLTPSDRPDKWSTYFEKSRVRFFAGYSTFWVIIGFSNFMGGGSWTGAILPLVMSTIGASSGHRIVQTIVPLYFAIMFIAVGVGMIIGAR